MTCHKVVTAFPAWELWTNKEMAECRPGDSGSGVAWELARNVHSWPSAKGADSETREGHVLTNFPGDSDARPNVRLTS